MQPTTEAIEACFTAAGVAHGDILPGAAAVAPRRVLRRESKLGNGDATLALYFATRNEIDTSKAARMLRLAAKQGNIWANYVLACSLVTGAHGQPRDLRKAHRTFLNLYRLNNGQFPGEHGQEDFYVWAYVCMEIGMPFPDELSAELRRLHHEPKRGELQLWSYILIDALREYDKSKSVGIKRFRDTIIQSEDDWNGWEWEIESEWGEKDYPYKQDYPHDYYAFYQVGHLDLKRNLLTSTPAAYGEGFKFDRIASKLRAIANKGVHEVQYILGLLGDTADDWLGRASDGGFSLASYHLGFCRHANEPEAALRHLRRVAYQSEENLKDFPEKFEIRVKEYDDTKEIVSEEFFKEIRDKALARIHEIERQLAEQRSREQTQRDMLSYLTHTLNNTFAGRPEAARQAMRILGSELYENNAGYTAINNIASMMSTFLFAQQLVNTFKIYVADPEALRKNWETDREGDASITTVLAISLRQTLSQLVFSSNQLDTLDRLLLNKGDDAIKNTRKSFMDEMIPLDVGTANAQGVFDWVRDHIGIIHVTIDPAAELHFHSNSTRFTFFFSGFSELIFNALKYSDATQPIEITWGKSGGAYVFRSENAWSEDSVSNRQGSDKGLVFLDRLTRMLGASLEKRTDGNRFIAEIRFPENLFKEAS